ncbi:hypothetical protein HanRHA438_Chr11g0487351 [Helianthus annuus]|nr:hypothetical protein HanRHA438_Chr11g0487351 [Helianthus annuus]
MEFSSFRVPCCNCFAAALRGFLTSLGCSVWGSALDRPPPALLLQPFRPPPASSSSTCGRFGRSTIRQNTLTHTYTYSLYIYILGSSPISLPPSSLPHPHAHTTWRIILQRRPSPYRAAL